MYDKIVGLENQIYYFQLNPLSILINKDFQPNAIVNQLYQNSTKIKFKIIQGKDEIFSDETTIKPVSDDKNQHFEEIVLNPCQLRFQVQNEKNQQIKYIKIAMEFVDNCVKGNHDEESQMKFEKIVIQPFTYIQKFKHQNHDIFEEELRIYENISLKFQLFLEESKSNLQALIENCQNQSNLQSPFTPSSEQFYQKRDEDKNIQENEFLGGQFLKDPSIIRTDSIIYEIFEQNISKNKSKSEKHQQKAQKISNNKNVYKSSHQIRTSIHNSELHGVELKSFKLKVLIVVLILCLVYLGYLAMSWQKGERKKEKRSPVKRPYEIDNE